MPGIYMRVTIGRPGASGANARYIARGSATGFDREAILMRNYSAAVGEASNYRELRDQLEEYCQQQEAHEVDSPRRGGGQTRTHYRVVLSFEEKVETAKARDLADQYLGRAFPNARAIAAVHQDTEHTHVHIHLQARDGDGHKLHFDRNTYRQLDHQWAELYGREFGREKAVEHEAKKDETRGWRRAAARARASGDTAPQPPDRAERLVRPDEIRSREERNHGFDQTRAGGPERDAASESPAAHGRERAADALAGARDRAVQAADRTTDEAGATVRAAEALADRELERDRDHVEERGR